MASLLKLSIKPCRKGVTVEFERPGHETDRWTGMRAYPSSGGLSVYAEDITNRKLTEQALRESELKFKTIFESTGDAIFIADLEGRIIGANKVASERHGCDLRQLLQMTTQDVATSEYAEQSRERLETVKRDGFAVFESCHRRFGGTPMPVHVDARLIDYEGRPAILAVARDISRRKEAEARALKAREEAEQRAAEFESFFSSIADGAALFDEDGTMVRINAAARDIFKIPPNIPIEQIKNAYKMETLAGEPMSVEEYASRRALKGESVTGARFRVVTAWSSMAVTVSGGPVRDSQGRILGAAVVWHDISEVIAAEENREKLYEREHRIADALQGALLSDVPDRIDGFKFETLYQAAWDEAQVGGDFYDVFAIGTEKIGIVIGDVSGKGLRAAVHVAMAKFSIRSRALFEYGRPAAVLDQVNKVLFADESVEGFVTVFFGILDCRAKTMTYTNAGQSPAVHWDHANGQARMLDSTGPVIGCDSDNIYEQEIVQLHPGDDILLGTDGLYEVRCGDEFLDIDGLFKLYVDMKHSGEDSAAALVGRVVDYCRSPLRDDMAVLRVSVVE